MASLRELEYLVTVSETGTISGAAVRLHVSQSALSQALASLERDFGGPLLHRDSRGVTLTPAARVVLPEARLALAAAERARRMARSVSGVDDGDLRIACAPSLILGVLPEVLRRWHREYPRIRMEIEEATTPTSGIDAVIAGRADLVIGASPRGQNTHGLDVHLLGSEELYVALAADDELGGRPLPDLAPLAHRRWVCYHREHPMDRALTELAAAAGFTPEPAVRVTETSAAPALAAAGLGPALIPHTVLLGRPYPGTLCRVGDGVFRDIVVARRVADALTTRFIAVLTDYGIPTLP